MLSDQGLPAPLDSLAVPAAPPPPNWGGAVCAVFQWQPDTTRTQQLQQELSRTQQELEALRALLEELPQIFERKYSERLQPLLERQQQLLQDNRALQDQIQRLSPSLGEVRLRFSEESAAAANQGLLLPALPKSPLVKPHQRRRQRQVGPRQEAPLSAVEQQPRDAWADPTRR